MLARGGDVRIGDRVVAGLGAGRRERADGAVVVDAGDGVGNDWQFDSARLGECDGRASAAVGGGAAGFDRRSNG